MPITEAEEQLRLRFMADIEHDYGKLTPSDLHILNLASYEYIKVYRMFGIELKSGELLSELRHHPTRMLLALLDSMAATRKERTKGKANESSAEVELRELLLSLSDGSTH